MLKITQSFIVTNKTLGSFNRNEGLKALCKSITLLISTKEFEDEYTSFEFEGCRYILHIGDDSPTTVLTNCEGKEVPAINLHRGFAEMRPITQAFVMSHEMGHYKMGHLERMAHKPSWAIFNLMTQIVGIDLQEFEADLYAIKKMRINRDQYLSVMKDMKSHLSQLAIAGIISAPVEKNCVKLMQHRMAKVLRRL
jgi:hypothetical protein